MPIGSVASPPASPQAATQEESGLDFRVELETKGYCIVPNVLSASDVVKARDLFFRWHATILADDTATQRRRRFNGIYASHGVGHAPLAWFVRTHPNVLAAFRRAWSDDDLVVSFDGCCYIEADDETKDVFWTHTDQAPSKRGHVCYQGLVALTHNRERTLVVYEASHRLHETYFRDRGMLEDTRDWHVLDEDFVANLSDTKRILEVPAGALVLWDSRLFHHAQRGKPGEERLVQYVCYYPRNHIAMTADEQAHRRRCFERRCTTTHWPAPMKVVSDAVSDGDGAGADGGDDKDVAVADLTLNAVHALI